MTRKEKLNKKAKMIYEQYKAGEVSEEKLAEVFKSKLAEMSSSVKDINPELDAKLKDGAERYQLLTKLEDQMEDLWRSRGDDIAGFPRTTKRLGTKVQVNRLKPLNQCSALPHNYDSCEFCSMALLENNIAHENAATARISQVKKNNSLIERRPGDIKALESLHLNPIQPLKPYRDADVLNSVIKENQRNIAATLGVPKEVLGNQFKSTDERYKDTIEGLKQRGKLR
jgi:hypothetical protein